MIVDNPRDPTSPAEQITAGEYGRAVHDTGMRSDFPPALALSVVSTIHAKGHPLQVMVRSPFPGRQSGVPGLRRVMPSQDPAEVISTLADEGDVITGITGGGMMVVLDRHGVAYVNLVSGSGVEYFRCGQDTGLSALMDHRL